MFPRWMGRERSDVTPPDDPPTEPCTNPVCYEGLVLSEDSDKLRNCSVCHGAGFLVIEPKERDYDDRD